MMHLTNYGRARLPRPFDRTGFQTGISALLVAVGVGCSSGDGARSGAGPTGFAATTGAASGNPTFVTAVGTGSLIADNSVLSYTLVPGLTATVTVPAGTQYSLLVETDGGVQLNSDEANDYGFTDIAVFVDGVQVGAERRVAVMNNASVLHSVGTFGFSVLTTVGAGTHTVTVRAKKFSAVFADCYVSSSASGSVLPGNPQLQAVLNIVAFQ